MPTPQTSSGRVGSGPASTCGRIRNQGTVIVLSVSGRRGRPRGVLGLGDYRTTVDLPELGPTARIHLDLGDAAIAGAGSTEAGGLLGHSFRAGIEPPIGVTAELRVNGVDCGLVSAPPYVVDVSWSTLSGGNRVEILVRNTAANAVAHDPYLPAWVADSERRYGRRFRMQKLDRAMEGIRSGLLAIPALVITD